MLDYAKQAEEGISRLNTPPSFGIYVMGRVFKWILDQGGGLEAVDRRPIGRRPRSSTTASTRCGGFYKSGRPR